MESFKIVIDGVECEAYPGETVLQVAERNGILIPVFCYHKELRPEGACRVCLVEVEGAPRLATACTLKAMPDMVVRTNTERVKKARAGVIELILNNHTLECPICDKSGECELQMVGFRYAPKKSRYREPRREKDIVIKGPLIEIDNDRCILCRRCIRMCGENMGNRVLGILKRGYEAYISPFNGDFVESGCEHCGSCIDVCPVGSLLDRVFKFSDRPWRMDRVWTTCVFCGSGCFMEVDSYKGRIKRVVGRIGTNPSHNRGYLCVRGRWGWDVVYSEKRLKAPLLKKEGELKEVSLEEAMGVLREVASKEVNLIVESSLTNEELELLKNVFGPSNVTSDAFTYQEALKGISEITGRRETASLNEIYKADIILAVEDFLEDTNPVVSKLLRLAVIQNGKRLIRIGSFPSSLDSIAFQSLKIESGEILDTVKHLILGTFDTSYLSGKPEVDRVSKVLRGKRVAVVIGGTVLQSPDIKEIAKASAYLTERLGARSSVIVIPQKANAIGVAQTFELQLPEELKAEVTVIVNSELNRDFPGFGFDNTGFTVLFTPFYTPDVPAADLVIPIETGLEKEGTVTGIDGKLSLSRSIEPAYSLKSILLKLPVKQSKPAEAKDIINKELGESRIEREEDEILLTVVPSKTGYNSVSYYSSNVSRVSGRNTVLLNPSVTGSKLVTLRRRNGKVLTLPVEHSREVPSYGAVLKVERFSREIAEFLEGVGFYTGGIPIKVIAEE